MSTVDQRTTHGSTAVTPTGSAAPATRRSGEVSPDPERGKGESSLGELVSNATRDLSTLLRSEVQLAKLELKREAVSAGKGAGMLGGAGVCGLFALIFLSIALAYAFSTFVPLGVGFLLVGVLYLLIAGVLALLAKKNFGRVGAPQKTLETVKDDLAWAKHPTAAPPRRTR